MDFNRLDFILSCKRTNGQLMFDWMKWAHAYLVCLQGREGSGRWVSDGSVNGPEMQGWEMVSLCSAVLSSSITVYNVHGVRITIK